MQIDLATIITVSAAATAIGGPLLYVGKNIGRLESTIQHILHDAEREREERIADVKRLHERIDERDC